MRRKKRQAHAPPGTARCQALATSPNLKLGARRLWAFRILASTGLPVLLLLLVELSLRAVGFGYPTGFFTRSQVDGREVYCGNPRFCWQFFPREFAPKPMPFAIPAAKPDRTYRIFVLGSSAAEGEPDPTFSFARVLEVLLRDRYPGVRFEVINAAMVAVNSYVMLEVAKDCSELAPDLFVIYLGNNEVVGPLGVGSMVLPISNNLSVTRAGIFLRGTKLGQVLTDIGRLSRRGKESITRYRIMEMLRERPVRADDPVMGITYAHFGTNLADIRRAARRAGSDIILCTVASNLKDCAPLGSLHRRGITEDEKNRWDKLYQAGVSLEKSGKNAEAIQSYLAAAKVDDTFADLQYRLGRCYEALGQYAAANDAYVRARDLDTVRMRADTRINNIIRDVAFVESPSGDCLADAVQAFQNASAHGFPGAELFWDHVHMTFQGNYILARTVCGRLTGLLPHRLPGVAPNAGLLLSEAECARRLAYTDWNRYLIAWNVLGHTEGMLREIHLGDETQVMRMRQVVQGLQASATPDSLQRAVVQYRQAIQDNPVDPFLRFNFGSLLASGCQDYAAAVEQFEFVLNALPQYAEPRMNIGYAMIKLGKVDEAIECFRHTLDLCPMRADAHCGLGVLLAQKGQKEEAAAHLREAVRIDPLLTMGRDALRNLDADGRAP
jgi:tetratricopeptide (TPR) repeat protein